jgi:phage terminase large subunit-like protein
LSAGYEIAFHMTGLYPEWWEGKRYPGPNNWWMANTNNETTRDNPQRILLGDDGEWGTGTIPRSHIARDPTMSRGFPNLVDTFQVRHVSGGISTGQFKAYDQGRKKWQGATLKGGIWFDEEPDEEIYSEGLARIAATSGCVFLTMTPLLGMSDVVLLFYPEPSTPARALVQMDIDDAGHFTEEERGTIVAAYRAHERDARARGIPLLGSGKVFQIPQESISVPSHPVPDHWARLGGVDFGYGDHPFAAVNCAWDRDSDCITLTHCYKEREPIPAVHASALRPWGQDLRYAWPHDGARDWGGSGPVAGVYRKEGLRMLREHSTFKEGGYSPEACVQILLSRMQTGRFKAFEHLDQFWNELSMYHRKDGLLVKKNDDILSALFKVLMMLRFARVRDLGQKFAPKVHSDFDPFDWKEA